MDKKDNIRLVIFDFDGTIADTAGIIVKTMRQTLRHLGLPDVTREQCVATIGLPLHECFTHVLPMTEEKGLECAEVYKSIFEDNNANDDVPLFLGVAATLRKLASRELMLSIASSRHSSSLNGFISHYGLTDIITLAVGGDMVSKAKPDPEPVLMTLRQLGAKPAEAIVVGDTTFDIEMGQQAGVKTCAVTYGYGQTDDLLRLHPDHVIDRFEQLADIL